MRKAWGQSLSVLLCLSRAVQSLPVSCPLWALFHYLNTERRSDNTVSRSRPRCDGLWAFGKTLGQSAGRAPSRFSVQKDRRPRGRVHPGSALCSSDSSVAAKRRCFPVCRNKTRWQKPRALRRAVSSPPTGCSLGNKWSRQLPRRVSSGFHMKMK